MNDLRFPSKLLASFCLIVVVVALCYAYVDRPLSIYLESLHLAYTPALRFFEYFPVFTIHATLVGLLAWTFLPERFKALKAARAGLKIIVTAALADFINNMLKGYFGRYWPRTWICDNPSLIHTNTYGFNFFQGGPGLRSFPSGHACVVTATAMAIALCYPRPIVRIVAALAAASTAVTILLQNFHFVGDLCAGTWLGATVAVCIHRAWPSSDEAQA
jgi:membrane-associated phospholipid phosphatase